MKLVIDMLCGGELFKWEHRSLSALCVQWLSNGEENGNSCYPEKKMWSCSLQLSWFITEKQPPSLPERVSSLCLFFHFPSTLYTASRGWDAKKNWWHRPRQIHKRLLYSSTWLSYFSWPVFIVLYRKGPFSSFFPFLSICVHKRGF